MMLHERWIDHSEFDKILWQNKSELQHLNNQPGWANPTNCSELHELNYIILYIYRA